MIKVFADIRYETGALAGLTLVEGFQTSMPTREAADRLVEQLRQNAESGAAIRAAVTGNSYQIVGGVKALPAA